MMNEDEHYLHERKQRREDKAASYDKPAHANKRDLIQRFSELLDWYGGVTDFEANMGTFWWTNKHGKTYTMIVHEVDE